MGTAPAQPDRADAFSSSPTDIDDWRGTIPQRFLRYFFPLSFVDNIE
jgi:hypothetical protein